MKNEEAYSYLEDLQRKYTRDRHLYKPEFIEANGLAILALEKQIPMKPIVKELKEYYPPTYWCSCGKQQKASKRWLKTGISFCERCGQALNWEE